MMWFIVIKFPSFLPSVSPLVLLSKVPSFVPAATPYCSSSLCSFLLLVRGWRLDCAGIASARNTIN